MSVRYVAVQWNRFKLVYDLAAALAIAGFLLIYEYCARTHLAAAGEGLSEPVRHMRAFGTCAFVLLSLILCLGPLARLDRRLLPLVYNRRHLGVALCAVASTHAYHVLGFYHAYSNVPKAVALLRFDAAFTRASLPFPLFGAAALLILMLMAAKQPGRESAAKSRDWSCISRTRWWCCTWRSGRFRSSASLDSRGSSSPR